MWRTDLLPKPQGMQRKARHFHHFEPHIGKVTNGPSHPCDRCHRSISENDRTELRIAEFGHLTSTATLKFTIPEALATPSRRVYGRPDRDRPSTSSSQKESQNGRPIGVFVGSTTIGTSDFREIGQTLQFCAPCALSLVLFRDGYSR
jgi:hypothetical protein